ncbi:MAG: DUF5711 family protein [Eubacterium sp.]|nr:DUF5711 family protein [Eubacterium sp.]
MRKRIIILGILAVAGLVLILYLIGQTHTYTDYEVLSSVERTDDETVKITSFKGNVLKYGSDGISLTDLSNNIIWNQSFEIESNEIVKSEEYVAVVETGGTQIYLFGEEGFVSKIETKRQTVRAAVSDIGTVATIEYEDGVNYIELFDSEGNELAEGEAHIENNGTPVSIALSPSGTLMAVVYFDYSSGEVASTVTFYNFGSVGQNEIDNIVSTNETDSVIAEIEFVTDDKCIAFGNNIIQVYKGKQKPSLDKEIEVEEEIESVFCENERFGYVVCNEDEVYSASSDAEEESLYTINVYNYKGRRLYQTGFDMSYDKIEVLENTEVCIMGTTSCEILSKWGKPRFIYTFEQNLLEVFSASSMHSYEVILSDHTEHIRLK